MDTLGSGRHGQQILAAWIGNERDALNLRAASPAPPRSGGTSAAGYPPSMTGAPRTTTIPELVTLARTVSRWEDEIVAAVLTG